MFSNRIALGSLALLLTLRTHGGQSTSPEGSGVLTIKPVVQRPCLLIDPAEVPEVKRRLEAMPDRPEADPRKMDPALYGLLFGDGVFRKNAAATFMRDVRRMFAVNPGAPLPGYRRYNEVLYKYDLVASFDGLSQAEQREFRDLMVRGAVYYTGEDPARFASKETPRNNGTEFPEGFSCCNRWTDQVLVAALTGLNFPELPLAAAWVGYAAHQIQYQLDHAVWDGAWNEVPRYHNWTVLLYSGFFQALRRRTGIDFYQHPNTKALLDWYVRFSSPLVRFPATTRRNSAGEPTLPAWGDSNYGPNFQACAMFAPHYAETDPKFARRLMWMWRRAGSPFQHGWNFDYTFPLQVDPALPDAPQTLGSAFCRKMGYVLMRSGFNTPDETAVTLRGGQRGGWHPRSDLGSIDLFSHGIPLVLGAQSGPYREPEILWNRSQQANNVVVFGGKSRDRREGSGTIEAFFSSPQADYVVTDCSRPAVRDVKKEDSFVWRRHLLLVKQPDYLVVWDEVSSPMSAEWFLHTTAERLEWEKGRVICHTAYNADLDVHVLAPAEPLLANEKEGPFGGWLYDDPKKGKTDPYPFMKLKFFSLAAQPNEPFITVLHPRRPEASALKPTLVSRSDESVTLRVELAGSIDEVTLRKDGGTFQRRGSPPLILPMQVEGNAEPGTRFIASK
jgi:hypothetical protein